MSKAQSSTVGAAISRPFCLLVLIRGRLIAGATVGEHTHETGSEIILALSGEATATTDGVEERLAAGDCHYCPRGHRHFLKNDGPEDFVFFAVVAEQ